MMKTLCKLAKRIFLILAASVLMLGCLPLTVYAKEDTTEESGYVEDAVEEYDYSEDDFEEYDYSDDYYGDYYTEYEAVICDYADLLSDEEEAYIYDYYMVPLLPYGNVIFQSVTLTSTNYEEYCERTYYEMYGNEPGVIFQIDMGNRKLTLSSSTDVDDVIAPERDSIVDNVYRYASDEEYARCVERCFSEVYDVLNDVEIAHHMKYTDNAILAIIVSLIVNYLFVFASSKKKAPKAVIASAVAVSAAFAGASVIKGKLSTTYSPISSGSGGSGGGGGGGGGGGFSGGSSSHGF